MINYIEIIKILTEWSFTNKEYEMTLFLYKTFNIGIPNKLLYKLDNKMSFYSLTSFLTTSDTKKIDDENLQKLFQIFSKSKYVALKHWTGKYGYCLLTRYPKKK